MFVCNCVLCFVLCKSDDTGTDGRRAGRRPEKLGIVAKKSETGSDTGENLCQEDCEGRQWNEMSNVDDRPGEQKKIVRSDMSREQKLS